MSTCHGVGGTGTQFSYSQLMQIWINAGGSRAAAPMAAAIAMAESSGCSSAALYDSNGTVDRGLWQINSSHGAQSTFDIMGNARSAVAISNNGSNWNPWTTYTSGAYRRYLNTSASPSGGSGVPSGGTAAHPGPGTAAKAKTSGGNFPGITAAGAGAPGVSLNPAGTGTASGAGTGGAGKSATVPGATSSSATLYGQCIGTTFPHTSWCIHKTWVRAFIGGFCIIGGFTWVIVGAYLVAKAAENTGAGRAVGSATQSVMNIFPPAGGTASALGGLAEAAPLAAL